MSCTSRCLASLEQAAMVEEHVHQLPEHVVERFHQLLPDRGVRARRLELPLGSRRFESERQAATLAGHGQRGGGLPVIVARAEADRDVVRLGGQLHLIGERPTLAGQRERGQGSLAHDHGVNELHGHVPGIRARRR